MSKDFGVGLGLEGVARLDEFFFQFEEVLNHPIMNHRQFSRLIEVGVGIFIGWCPMRRPPGVADSQFAWDGFGLASVGQIFNPTAFLTNLHAMSIQDRQTGRVIAPVLEAAECFEEDGLGLSRPDIGNNSTHRKLVLAGGCDRVKR